MNRILTSLKHEMTCKRKRTPIKIVQVLLLLHVQAWVIYNTIYQRPAYNYGKRSLKKTCVVTFLIFPGDHVTLSSSPLFGSKDVLI